jgi:hypothetical protein
LESLFEDVAAWSPRFLRLTYPNRVIILMKTGNRSLRFGRVGPRTDSRAIPVG